MWTAAVREGADGGGRGAGGGSQGKRVDGGGAAGQWRLGFAGQGCGWCVVR
jgi:hypothetical protein